MEENKVAIQLNYKAFEMIQEFNDDPEKRLRLYDLIFKSAFLGEEINDEDMAVRMTAKSILLDIEQCRNNYIEKCKNNAKYGIQGKEYGIQGKEFGKLGGRPRKGETKEQYAERKKEENAEWEKQQEICGMITSAQDLVDFIKCAPQNQLQTLIDEYVSKGYTKSQVNKAFEYIRSKNG